MTAKQDRYGKDHSNVPNNEFDLRGDWAGCYAAHFLNGKVSSHNSPTKHNEIVLREWERNGFKYGDRWEVI